MRTNLLRRMTAGLCFLTIGGIVAAGSASAQTCTPGPAVWQLTAGQNINVGTVTVSNDETNLIVEYDLTYPGATFLKMHLWAGSDLTNLPVAGNGAPIPGQFKQVPEVDATGQTTHTFEIPLTALGIVDVKTACPLALFVVPHAEVVLPTSEPGKHETAFGGPIPAGAENRWWFYGKYCLTCNFDEFDFVCTTAFAKGGHVFVTDEKKSNPEKLPSLQLTKNRWGWAINVTRVGSETYDIWAGAGLNNTSNGVKVGTLTVDWDGSYATVKYAFTSPNNFGEIHIYASDSQPTTTAPGQYGITKYFDPKTSSYSETIPVADVNGGGIWIVAHAVACYPK